jgi:hypothetical protein
MRRPRAASEEVREGDMAERLRPTGTVDERTLLAVIAVLCGLLVTGGVIVPYLVGARSSPPAVTLGDVSDAHIVEIRDVRGATLLSGEFRSRVDALGNVEKDAALSDPKGRRIIGEVELEIPAAGRPNRRAELEVDVMGLPASATFQVVIDDRVVGSFKTDDRGSFDMELQEGELSAPPPG